MSYKKIYIGTSGYYNIEVNNCDDNKDTLLCYSKHLNSVEINYTFYHYPTKSLINNLKNHNLVYSIKVNKYITHTKKLADIQNLWIQFYDLFTLIHDKIKCFLFQFSKTFYKTDKNNQRVLQL